jgi:hypothetical protein
MTRLMSSTDTITTTLWCRRSSTNFLAAALTCIHATGAPVSGSTLVFRCWRRQARAPCALLAASPSTSASREKNSVRIRTNLCVRSKFLSKTGLFSNWAGWWWVPYLHPGGQTYVCWTSSSFHEYNPRVVEIWMHVESTWLLPWWEEVSCSGRCGWTRFLNKFSLQVALLGRVALTWWGRHLLVRISRPQQLMSVRQLAWMMRFLAIPD